MKEFVFKRGTDLWPVGDTLWHVYALPDLSRNTSLAKLVDSCRDAVRDEPITIVDPPWLHVTVAQVSDAVGRSTSADEIKELKRALQAQLQSIDPFEILVGSCLSYPSGLVFDLSPDDELNRLRDAVAEVIGRVRGPGALGFDPGVLHLTLGYAAGDADSDVIQRRLRRVRPSHSPMAIGSVWLVEVAADPDAKTITWAAPHPDQQIRLGSAPT